MDLCVPLQGFQMGRRVLAVIPARCGSKGVKNKNILSIKGTPMAIHSYMYTKTSSSLCDTLISTDSERYAGVFKAHGVTEDEIHIRPKLLGLDMIEDFPVVIDALAGYYERYGLQPEFVAIVRPTSPFRPSGLLETAVDMLDKNRDASSVRAVRKVKEHPYRVWMKESSRIVPLLSEGTRELGNMPRQSLPQVYYFQSGEIELVRTETVLKGSVSGDYVLPLEMMDENPDIDSKQDLESIR